MGFGRGLLRSQALERIAFLSVKEEPAAHESDFNRLLSTCRAGKQAQNGAAVEKNLPMQLATSQVAMTLREFDVLIALCKTTPILRSLPRADMLFRQLQSYLVESCDQKFAAGSTSLGIRTSPWTYLTSQLTSALLTLAVNHNPLRDGVVESLNSYIERVSDLSLQSDGGDTIGILVLTNSFGGFLEACAGVETFWNLREALPLLLRLYRLVDEGHFHDEKTENELSDQTSTVFDHGSLQEPIGRLSLRHKLSELWAVVLDSATNELVSDEMIDASSGAKGGNVFDTDSGDLKDVAEVALKELRSLDTALELSDAKVYPGWERTSFLSTKAAWLKVYTKCLLLDTDTSVDALPLCEVMIKTVNDSFQMTNVHLAIATVNIMPQIGGAEGVDVASLMACLQTFIVESPERFRKEGYQWSQSNFDVVKACATSLSKILFGLRSDAADSIITALNTFGHVLSTASPEQALKSRTLQPFDQQTLSSCLSLADVPDDSRDIAYSNVIEAIVSIAVNCGDHETIALAQSILIQRMNKVSKVVDSNILSHFGQLFLVSGTEGASVLLQILSNAALESVWGDDRAVVDATVDALTYIAKHIDISGPLYGIYLSHIIEEVCPGTLRGEGSYKDQEFTRRLEQVMSPLADLLSRESTGEGATLNLKPRAALREFWLHCAAHGYVIGTKWALDNASHLRTIARATPPLIFGHKERDLPEDNLENDSKSPSTVPPPIVIEHKQRLISMLPGGDASIRTLQHSSVLLLEAICSLELLRAEAGGCSKVLVYFTEPSLKSNDAHNCLVSLCTLVADSYLARTQLGVLHDFTTARLALELRDIFVGCCHRLESVQKISIAMADRLIATVPSAVCQKASLYALLELLTLVWTSCLKEETDQYTIKSVFSSKLGGVEIEMSDSYSFRRKTLRALHARSLEWVRLALNISPLDLKGLLQSYLSEIDPQTSLGHVSLGRSFALQMGSAVPGSDQKLASIDLLSEAGANLASDFMKHYTGRQSYSRPSEGIRDLSFAQRSLALTSMPDCKGLDQLVDALKAAKWNASSVPLEDLKNALENVTFLLCNFKKEDAFLIRHLVRLPCTVFTGDAIKLGIIYWTGIMNERPDLRSRLLVEIVRNFEATVIKKMGMFSESFGLCEPFASRMEYAPSNKEQHMTEQKTALDLFSPHQQLLHILSSHYHARRHGDIHLNRIMLRLVRVALTELRRSTGHPLARESRFQLINLGIQVLQYTSGITERQQIRLKELVLAASLSWFKFSPRWSFGSNRLQVKAEAHLLSELASALHRTGPATIGGKSTRLRQDLLLLLLENEQTRLATWLYPLDHSRKHHLLPNYPIKPVNDSSLLAVFEVAWREHPAIALNLANRFQSARLKDELRRKILAYPERVLELPEAIQIMLRDKLAGDLTFQLRYLLVWAPINPITAATFFLPAYMNNPFILQYAMRSLESHSVDVTFFYVPQIVQTLRYDALGYVERFILETAAFSQLFAHQIIWNMKANAYKDEESQIPDPVKPTLDHVMKQLLDSFSTLDRTFYEREFNFFGEVTSISGKLRPLIRKTKPEKNAKIAEELERIQVDVGVYLPSNPDSVVIDIDRKSGKSLQSHAKAPFMATFKIRRKSDVQEHDVLDKRGNRHDSMSTVTKELWQAAIFKVGDDCRQDMLALQLISAFRSVFNSVGLDVYVFPYRVTATAPGCGVIDVLPNSISRDMLGRDYDMGLYDYFINKYGDEDSIRFQDARNCFIKSMAAYSVISYLLKFKDRHNGNIMLDDAGHILHIDFGFCFDIAPGGITFERAPFKLTAEMVSVMGGSTDSQSYLWFEELCIKSFLACRGYVETLTHCVILMLDSGLPCFKPETIQNFRDRFVLDKNDREAADYMRYLVKKSYSSYSTGQYDRFQHLTNGIPY